MDNIPVLNDILEIDLLDIDNDDSIYLDHGYESRGDYLECLAEDYGVPLGDVIAIATLLGSGEDFDGLVAMVSDIG